MYIKYIFIQIFTYKGFGISDVGNVLAISSLISVIIQPLMAKLIEKNKNFTVKKFIIHSLFIIAITSIVIFSINNKLLILIYYNDKIIITKGKDPVITEKAGMKR